MTSSQQLQFTTLRPAQLEPLIQERLYRDIPSGERRIVDNQGLFAT
ncbi:MAG: hypothetical protein KDA66_12715 [Planctomycetaceae bacterium]|nr:hypothetical protein [Planctomycetaceae bacterium]